MSRPSIALAIIAKDEEHNLPILLDSVQGCFDTIYVTDTGSKDTTKDIARKYGCEVRDFKWVNDFSQARNASFSDIKEDYICWLDCDDSLQNPEGFKLWRDDILCTADYWIASYHYASDGDGKPACTFARERVIKNNGKFNWKYFVHEGIVPKDGSQVKAGYIQTWAVKHRRTSADLAKDKGRNLKLFEHNLDHLDNRMKYYYGKEFFENNEPIQAVRWLTEAISSNDGLEMHDRLLGTQYCIYALIQLNQLDKAIQLGLTALQIFPHRAEMWNSIGDCLIKQGKIHEALPFFSAAKNCPFHDSVKTGVALPVFNMEAAYTFYPRNQIARIHSNMGHFDAAHKEISECLELFDNEESRTMDKEINKIRSLTAYSGSKKKVEDIVISGHPGGPYEWDYDIYKKQGIGGSETAAVEMADHLHKLSGRKVIIFNNRTSSKNCGGVEYHPMNQAPQYFAEHNPYFHIAWRHNFKLTNAPTYLWNHDLMTPGGENHSQYRRSLALSQFHQSFLRSVQGIPEDKIRITRNGINPERFNGLDRTKKPIIVFRSSPDRGLDRALAVMDIVRSEMDLELHVYYGFDNLYKNNRGPEANKLKKMCEERSWVKLKGNVDQNTLSQECAQAMVWLYPTDFTETYCIGAIESLCEGVYPVVRQYGALKDTLATAAQEGMADLVDLDCATISQERHYAERVWAAVHNKKWEKVSVDPKSFSWEGVAKDWLKWFEEDKD
jgi:glycosyltransferase involved in cell wall biosynthesis